MVFFCIFLVVLCCFRRMICAGYGILTSASCMEVRIHLPKPLLTLTIVAVGLLWWNGMLSFHWSNKQQADAVGGVRSGTQIVDATQDIDRERVKQAVLSHQEEILRYQVQLLESEALADPSAENQKAFSDARRVLLGIIQERTQSEKLLALSLEQLWQAEGTSFSSVHIVGGNGTLQWPVEPKLGISATFEDAEYKKRFGVAHHAVDIPTEQGTIIRAPRAGVVLKVALNGLGYSYVVLAHDGDLQTIYGHISAALVQEGDHVELGQAIAKSGGQPGTAGAGLLTTGPHLHFAVQSKGVLVDPLQYLPTIGGE